MKKLSGGFGNGLERYIATAYQVSVADASGLRFISSMYSSSMGMYMFVFCKGSSIRRTSNEVGNKQETSAFTVESQALNSSGGVPCPEDMV